MSKRVFTMCALAGALALAAGVAPAADQDRAQTQTQDRIQSQTQERIYGSQLMTRQERVEYRARMRAAKTAEEREQIRLEHHKQMQERARERGVTLPDMPPAYGGGMGPGGGGMGPGGGMGGGMGPGGGMGGGGRR